MPSNERPSEPLAPGTSDLDPDASRSDPASEDTIDFDSSSGSGASATGRTVPPTLFPGYRLTGATLQGGQGVLYQAIQNTTKRRVVIKVIKEGPFASAPDQLRFEREIEILAQLKHPGVVAVHDTGVVAGCHYFVMDYIEGSRLDEHMRTRPRSVRETLDLFGRICRIVNAAHLHGVIHRDLKPGNIRIDPDGEPHVLDFGLAKTTSTDGEDSAMTRTGQFMGSLPWASPEQAEAVPGRVDVRTDVYSLGMIFYHMLTDRFPFDHEGSVRDLLDRIVVAEPISPHVFRSEIDDEVETIVLRCLSKKPERRYQTAGELARDVARYLDGDPIEAKRESFGYVLRKTISRHRVPVAVGVGVVVLLAVSLIATSALYLRARQAEAEAVAATTSALTLMTQAQALRAAEMATRLRAEEEAREAQAVTDFLVGVLGLADPGVTLSREVTLRDMLDAASARVSTKLAGQPEVEATVRSTIGTAYGSLGELRLADVHLRRAREIRESIDPEDAEGLYATLRPLMRVSLNLGASDISQVWVQGWKACAKLLAAGDESIERAFTIVAEARTMDERDSLFVDAMALVESSLAAGDPRWPLVADQLHLFGLSAALGDRASAEGHLRGALRIRRRELPETHPDIATVLSDLVGVLRRTQQPEKALALVDESIDIRRRVLPEGHLGIAISQSQRGACLVDLGRHAEAESLLVVSHEVILRTAGPRSPVTAQSARRLVRLYQSWSRPAQAEKHRREFFDVYAGLEFLDQWSTLRPILVSTLEFAGQLMDRVHDLDDSESGGALSMAARNEELASILDELEPEVLRLFDSYEPAAVVIARYLTYAADIWYPGWLRQELSERMALFAMPILETWADRIPDDVAYVVSEVAWHAMHHEEHDRAVTLARRAWDLTRQGYGEASVSAKLSERMVGITLVERGDYAEAEPLLVDSYVHLRKEVGPEAPVTRQVLTSLMELYDGWGRPELARPYLVAASSQTLPRWPLIRPFLDRDHPELVHGLDSLRAVVERGKVPSAQLVGDVVARGRRAFTSGDSTALVYAQLLHTWGVECDHAGCAVSSWSPLGEEVLRIRRDLLGEDHPTTLLSMNSMAWQLRDTDRLDEAEILAREAVQGLKLRLGANASNTLATLDTWAVVLHRMGRYAESLAAFEDLLERDRRSLAQDDAAVLEHRIHYGEVLTDAERFADAEAELLEVRDQCHHVLGPEHRLSGAVAASLEALYRMWERPDATHRGQEVTDVVATRDRSS